MNFNEIEKLLGISDEKLIQHFFPYLLLKRLQYNFETGELANLSDTRDSIIIDLLGPESITEADKIISNFDISYIFKKLIEFKLIEETDNKSLKNSVIKTDRRGRKGKLLSVTDNGKRILETKKNHLNKFLIDILTKPEIENK